MDNLLKDAYREQLEMEEYPYEDDIMMAMDEARCAKEHHFEVLFKDDGTKIEFERITFPNLINEILLHNGFHLDANTGKENILWMMGYLLQRDIKIKMLGR